MEFSFNLLNYFEKVVGDAAKKIETVDDSFEPQIRVADERLATFRQMGFYPLQNETELTRGNLLRTSLKKSQKTNFGKPA